MLPGVRRNRILELLQINRNITVKNLCDSLEASEATIRRDLVILEGEGKLERTHGGAIPVSQTSLDYEESFGQKETKYEHQKRAIARKAFEFLADNDSIVLDAGTTTLELARLIGQSSLHLTVITNSTVISSVISYNSNVDLIAIGGKVRLNVLATVGSIAVEMLRRFNVSKAFIGVNGLTVYDGLTTPDVDEAEIKRVMLTRATERFVLTDHTKFNRVALCQIAPISMVDYVITDRDIDPSLIPAYESNDIRIIQA